MSEYANDYKDFDIQMPANPLPNDKGEVYTVCNVCRPDRKSVHQSDKKLAVNVKKGTWFCQHCGWTGGLTPVEFLKGKKIVDPSVLQMPEGKIYKFFEKRGISRKTVDWCGTRYSVQSVKQKGTDDYIVRDCVAFVYRMRGLIRMIKYRDPVKNFKIAPESTLIAWGLDFLKNEREGLITEGEIDAYSYIEAGYKASTSVPNGTTISEKEKKVYLETGKMPSDIHLNLTWLDNSYEYYDELETIYICTDDDPAGVKLRLELGRRLGFDRCRIVKYGTYTYINAAGDTVACKDANDVLIHHGKEAVLDTLKNAQSFPITDVVTVEDISDELDDLYKNGITKGKTTGWPHLDPYFTWVDGHFIVFNGFPGQGKTTLMLNMIIMHSILYNSRWGIYCPENYPIKNAYAICFEIFGGNTMDMVDGRMDSDTYKKAKKFIHDHIEFVNNAMGYTAADLRDLSMRMIKQRGLNGFVIDPWNSLKPSKGKYNSHDEEYDGELSAEQRFAANTNTYRLILAHPPTPIRDKEKVYPAPSPFEIKGGGIWFAKAYEMICIHQKYDGDNKYTSEIHVQKTKDKKAVGMTTYKDSPLYLNFERRTQRFVQPDGFNPFTQEPVVVEQELDLCF